MPETPHDRRHELTSEELLTVQLAVERYLHHHASDRDKSLDELFDHTLAALEDSSGQLSTERRTAVHAAVRHELERYG